MAKAQQRVQGQPATRERGLTAKQESFCRKYVELGNASKAYAETYNTDRMKDATINRSAHDLLHTPKIQERIAQLQKGHAKRHDITVDTLIEELEEARQMALEGMQPSAAISATMGKAKLLGLEKQVTELAGQVKITTTPLSEIFKR